MKVHLEDLGDYPLPRHIVTVVKQVLREGLRVVNEAGAADSQDRSGLQRIARQRGRGVSTLNVAFVSEEEITKLNNAYRDKNSPTDVLSFPGASGLVCSLGDIVICSSVAAKQAEGYSHSLEREIAFLALHGLLHLLGYSHEEGEQGKETEAGNEMVNLQNKILESLGIVR